MSKTQELAQIVAANKVHESKRRDKYGRGVTEYSIRVYDEATKSPTNPHGFLFSRVAVVVNLPKSWTEARDTKFLVNDWSAGIHEGVTYHANRLDAHLTAVRAVVAAAAQ
jgi:hypothetical protein